jgi:transcriptional regulator with XRE-family HTH domain
MDTMTPLRTLRLLQGFRLRDVSAGTTIYTSRLSRLERGLVRPYKREIRALAMFFAVQPEVIFPNYSEHED